jgi:hypothetical protein
VIQANNKTQSSLAIQNYNWQDFPFGNKSKSRMTVLLKMLYVNAINDEEINFFILLDAIILFY